MNKSPEHMINGQIEGCAVVSVPATDRNGVKSYMFFMKRTPTDSFLHWQASSLSLIRMGIIEVL